MFSLFNSSLDHYVGLLIGGDWSWEGVPPRPLDDTDGVSAPQLLVPGSYISLNFW